MRRTISLRNAWWLCGGVFLALMLHLAVYRFGQGNCTSTACTALAALHGALTVGVMAVALLFDVTAPARRRLANVPPLLYLAVTAAALFGFGLIMRPEWVYAHMAIALGGLGALGYWTLYGTRLPRLSNAAAAAGLALLAGAVLVVRALTVAYVPNPHILDEPWTFGWALSYLRTGQPSDWIMSSVSGIPYYSLPRYYALVALWMQAVGVGLWEGRLFSLLVTALMIGVTVRAAWLLFDRATAVAVLLALLASSVAVVGLRLRHDVGVGLAQALALLCYAHARRRNNWLLHGLAGLCAGLGVAAHYHAVGLSIALFIGLYLPAYVARLRDRQLFPPREAVAFAVGALVSGVSLLLWQILPDIAQFQLYLAPRMVRNLSEFADSFGYHIAQVVEHSRLEFLLLAAAVVAAIVRRCTLDLSLALALGLSYVALGVLASLHYGPFDYYSVPLVPLFGLLIGRLFSGWPSPARGAAVAAACTCLIMPQLGYVIQQPLTVLRSNLPVRPEAPPAAQWVLDNIDHDQTIAAEHWYFLWLYDYPFLSPLTPHYGAVDTRPDANDPAALRQAWSALAPDLIIFDSTLSTSALLAVLRDEQFLDVQGYALVYTNPNPAITIFQRD
jgi:hypothetical protein